MNDFHDRLLDAGLRAHSDVVPPEGFAERAVRAVPPRRWTGNWAWMLAPAAAAVAAALVMIAISPATPATRQPGASARAERAVAATPALVVQETRRAKAGRVRRPPRIVAAETQGIRYRVLTGAEIARMDLPAALLAPREENPIVELQVQELSVKPLEGEKENERN